MKKILFVMAVILLLNLSLISAITQQEINEAKSLIDSKADCKSLSDSQLEIIGEYEMELMHPGESHELMHQMMGLKEGSEEEKLFHISMAKSIYCGESSGMIRGGMMNMMMGGNMMGSGGVNMMGINTGYGMMGNYGYGYWDFLNVLSLILLIGLVILVYLWVIRLWRDMQNKSRKK